MSKRNDNYLAEETLIGLLGDSRLTTQVKAILLQMYVQEYGPVSDENGDKIRELLGG